MCDLYHRGLKLHCQRRRSHLFGPRRCVFLGLINGGMFHCQRAHCRFVQFFPRPLHRRFHRRRCKVNPDRYACRSRIVVAATKCRPSDITSYAAIRLCGAVFLKGRITTALIPTGRELAEYMLGHVFRPLPLAGEGWDEGEGPRQKHVRVLLTGCVMGWPQYVLAGS